MEKKYKVCKNCVLDETVPEIEFNREGVCNYCELHEKLDSAFPNDERGQEIIEDMFRRLKDDGKGKNYDCIIGISGGVDSSYLIYLAKSHGLRPLAVHVDNGWNSEISRNNIKKSVEKFSVDLYTYKIKWEEMRDVLKSFMKASYIWADGPTDSALLYSLYKVAKEKGIKNILVGNNFRTEGRQPVEWTHVDARCIKYIHRKYGNRRKLNSYHALSNFDLFKYEVLFGIKIRKPLYFLDYDKEKAKKILEKKFNWRDYGGHHHESIYTRFIIGFWLPFKFGVDKRKITFSAQIRSGFRNRDKALKELETFPYNKKQMDLDRQFILKKLGFSASEFEKILKAKNRTFRDYPSSYNLYQFLGKYMKFIYKIFGIKPMMAFDLPSYENQNKTFCRGTKPKRNILYLVHNYHSFQKNPIEKMAKHFEKVYVIVRYKPISRIARFLPIAWLKKYDDSSVIDFTEKPENVYVFRSYVWYLPFGFFNKLAGYFHFRAVKKTIEKHNLKFDIIHSHFLWSAGYVGMKLKEVYAKPFVVTGHGFDVYDLPFTSKYWKKMTEKILNSADHIISVSRYNLQYFKKLSVDDKKISVVNNGFNAGQFNIKDKQSLRRKHGVDLEKKIVLSVGNLEKVKGYENLIKAIALIPSSKIGVEFYIVGGGPREKTLKDLIKDLKLEKKVFLMGNRAHVEVSEWMGLCDMFVLPSLQEGASVVLLEALASGQPVVATRVGIVPEVLTSSKFGYIAKNKNIKDLSQKIEFCLNRKWDSVEIVKAVDGFTWESAVSRILEIYKKFL